MIDKTEKYEVRTKKSSVPFPVKFSFVWVIFFIIVGFVLNWIRIGELDFNGFFVEGYKDWFNFFLNFNTVLETYGKTEVISFFSIYWSYFFITGGLIALLWSLISWALKMEKHDETSSREIFVIKETTIEKDLHQEIERMLDEGKKLLASGRLKEAEDVYNEMRKRYNSSKTFDKVLYARIGDFYKDLVRKMSEK
jgi:hypothetical protein